jgi:hypothetical protein
VPACARSAKKYSRESAWKVHRTPPIVGTATGAELSQLAAAHGLAESDSWTGGTLSYELRRMVLDGVEWQLDAIGRGFSKVCPVARSRFSAAE